MLRYFFIALALLLLTIVSITGLRGWKSDRPPLEIFPDMVRQAKYKAQSISGFYADGRSARTPLKETVPLGYTPPLSSSTKEIHEGEAYETPYTNIHFTGAKNYLNTGRMGDYWGTGIPFEVTPAFLKRGEERYQITCAVCHGATAAGNGIVGKYGLNGIANLHQQRLLDMADGEIFNTITWGKNTMLGYGSNIQISDRWAIIAYLRTLQRAHSTSLEDLTPKEKDFLNSLSKTTTH